VGIFVKILRVRAAILAPVTALITLLGAYTINNSMFDVTLVVVFGIIGYLMKKFGFEPGPLVLAFVLGELLESSMRRSLLVFGGDPLGFFGRPISATLLVVFVLVAVLPVIRGTIAKRKSTATTSAARAEIKEKV
jgi:putative tricarboxylic transport membrane protein